MANYCLNCGGKISGEDVFCKDCIAKMKGRSAGTKESEAAPQTPAPGEGSSSAGRYSKSSDQSHGTEPSYDSGGSDPGRGQYDPGSRASRRRFWRGNWKQGLVLLFLVIIVVNTFTNVMESLQESGAERVADLMYDETDTGSGNTDDTGTASSSSGRRATGSTTGTDGSGSSSTAGGSGSTSAAGGAAVSSSASGTDAAQSTVTAASASTSSDTQATGWTDAEEAITVTAAELEGRYDDLYYSDPEDDYKWHYINAYLYKGDPDDYDWDDYELGYVSIDLNEDGSIDNVSYYVNVDVTVDMDETIENIRTTMAALYEPLSGTTLAALNPLVFSVDGFDEFFLSEIAYRGYYYPNASYCDYLGENDEYELSEYYLTDREKDFDEYSYPCVCIWIDEND